MVLNNPIPLTPEDRSTINGAPIFPHHKQILQSFLTGRPVRPKQATAIRNDPECLIVMQNILGDRYPAALAILNQGGETKVMKFLGTIKEIFMIAMAIVIIISIAIPITRFLTTVITGRSQTPTTKTIRIQHVTFAE